MVGSPTTVVGGGVAAVSGVGGVAPLRYTGSAAAFLFGIKFRHSFPAVLAGVLIASIVVSAATYGVATVIKLV